MKKEVVEKIIRECVEKIYSKDEDLFKRELCERCLMFRLAHYLQLRKELSDYFVDCEFNKALAEDRNTDKMNFHKINKKFRKMYADITIHKRSPNPGDNFICLEVKRFKQGMDKDGERLEMMTSRDGFEYKGRKYIYNYDFGFLVYLPKDKDKSKISIFQSGREIS